MRVGRLLGVPVAIAAAVLFAAPALATAAPKPTVVLNVSVDCHVASKFCFDFVATTTNIPAGGRDVVVTVFGVQRNGQSQALGSGQNVHFGENAADQPFSFCFPVPADVTFTRFVVQVKLIGTDLSVTLNGSSDLHVIPPSSGGGLAVLASLDNICATAPSPSPSPSLSPSASPTVGPTPTATPSSGTPLAQTGGLDLGVLAVGGALLLVGLVLLQVSRQRPRLS